MEWFIILIFINFNVIIIMVLFQEILLNNLVEDYLDITCFDKMYLENL